MNVLKRCVGTRAHLNTSKCITAAVLQIFAVFITWIATACGMLGLEIIYMQILMGTFLPPRIFTVYF